MEEAARILKQALSEMDDFSYQINRKNIAQEYGVKLEFLDKQYKNSRKSMAMESENTLGFEDIVPAEELVDGEYLLDALVDSVSRFVVLPEGGAQLCALWVVFAWAHEFFLVSPILAIQSPQKGSGKTTLLDWLSKVVPKPLPTSHASTAAVFRVIEAWCPTLLIDEADAFLRDNEDMRAILNSGHVRTTARVLRTVESKNGHDVRAFSSWAPKAISGIGQMADTLQDRSLVLQLQRKRGSEHVQRLRLGYGEEFFMEIKQQAKGFAVQHAMDFSNHDPVIPNGLNNRQADNWSPLFTIADIAGGHWPQTARVLAENSKSFEDKDHRTQLLKDINRAFEECSSKDRISTSVLLKKLTEIDDSPWIEWTKGRPITARQLAGLLNPYGISSEKLWIDGVQAKGYRRASFLEAWERYLSSEVSDSECTRVLNTAKDIPENKMHWYGNDGGTDKKGTGTVEGTLSKDCKSIHNIELPSERYLCTETAPVMGPEVDRQALWQAPHWDTYDPDKDEFPLF